ncbi:MAG TPA: rod shape-determining protein MreD [Niabella sp.]|nr:rod shape-determining protein MreD [Niabella sp.]HQW15257.1 rod shape-determining protein MreD [Niabella sp.]HQX20493.1 rod shape-determining protein MreD [Niabella sp.]HQX42576.1 rod shape-determining protein MreD [Niabella sp.]HRB06888.1 rod shape-determining protein MreD [Niabella sp.]
MSDLVRNIIRFVLFVFLQVYVLDKMPRLHQFISPYIYFLYILWLPFFTKRGWVIILGLFLGLSIDYYSVTPGLHAAACVLIAYLRPFVINLFAPKDATEFSYKEPSSKAMGWSAYLLYALILSFFHNSYLLFLEWLSFGSFIEFLMKVIITTAISMVMIGIAELIFPRKLKFRSNTV